MNVYRYTVTRKEQKYVLVVEGNSRDEADAKAKRAVRHGSNIELLESLPHTNMERYLA